MSEAASAARLSITAKRNGPLQVSGPCTFTDHDGRVVALPAGDSYLCRCGLSRSKPFCDGSHAAGGFDGTLAG